MHDAIQSAVGQSNRCSQRQEPVPATGAEAKSVAELGQPLEVGGLMAEISRFVGSVLSMMPLSDDTMSAPLVDYAAISRALLPLTVP